MKIAEIIKYTYRNKEYYRFEQTINGRKFTKTSKYKDVVLNYKKTIIAAIRTGTADLIAMSPLKLLDIRVALTLLPEGVSLEDCVRSYEKSIELAKSSIKTIEDAKKEFLENKEGKVKDRYYRDVKFMLNRFALNFVDWHKATSESFMRWIRSVSEKPKTQKHYFTTVKEFYDFSVKKGYCNNDIFKNIHKSEVPKVVRTEISALSISDAIEFFARIERFAPQRAGLFALIAFGGFRLAEAQRITAKSINWDRKEIILPFKDSKTGQNWLQANMPDNVWKWLEKYPPNDTWKVKLPDSITKLKKGLKFDKNALRHSFATYHLSLYRDAPKTSIMLRHTNPNQLWQTYLAGLNSEDEAKKYFSIVPKE